MAFESAVAVNIIVSEHNSLAAHTADNITDNWYAASKELEDFQDLEKKVKQKVDIWKEALRNEGMPEDIRLREPLNDAIKCLVGEKIKMDTVQSNFCMFRFMFMFKAQPFPPLLKDSMQRVVDAFDNIQKAYTQTTRILEELANNRLEPYQIIVDTRIAKLVDTKDKVMQHLNDKTGNNIVWWRWIRKNSIIKSTKQSLQMVLGFYLVGTMLHLNPFARNCSNHLAFQT